MAITFTWVVESMDCYPSVDGKTDVAKTVRWRCNATDGTQHAATYGSVDLDPYVAGSPFTAFASLTQADVVGWVKAKLGTSGVAAIEKRLSDEITAPAVVTPKLPWVK